MVYILSPYLFVAVKTEGRIGKVTLLLLSKAGYECDVPQRYALSQVLGHRSQRTRRTNEVVLRYQETLVTILTRSVWFSPQVTVL